MTDDARVSPEDGARWDATVEGQELIREGDLQGAVAELERVLVEDPENEHAAFFLASALHSAGKMVKAKAAFERTLDIYPEHLGAWVGLGHLCYATGDHHEAVNAAKQMLEIKPDDVDGEFLLGLASAALERFTTAAQSFRKVMTDRRASVELRTEAARLLEEIHERVFPNGAPQGVMPTPSTNGRGDPNGPN